MGNDRLEAEAAKRQEIHRVTIRCSVRIRSVVFWGPFCPICGDERGMDEPLGAAFPAVGLAELEVSLLATRCACYDLTRCLADHARSSDDWVRVRQNDR